MVSLSVVTKWWIVDEALQRQNNSCYSSARVTKDSNFQETRGYWKGCIYTGWLFWLIQKSHFCVLGLKLDWFPPIVDRDKDWVNQFSLNPNTFWNLLIGTSNKTLSMIVFGIEKNLYWLHLDMLLALWQIGTSSPSLTRIQLPSVQQRQHLAQTGCTHCPQASPSPRRRRRRTRNWRHSALDKPRRRFPTSVERRGHHRWADISRSPWYNLEVW